MRSDAGAALAASFPARPGSASVTTWIRGPVLARARELVGAAGGRPLAEIEVGWDLRGRMAGQARLLDAGRGLVRLNRQLFEFGDAGLRELIDTVLHEVAHLCVFLCWPRARPHGRRWQAMAVALGARPRATHRLPFARARAVREYAYRVADHTIWLGAVRHRRLQSGRARYRVRTRTGIRTIAADAFTGEERRVGAEALPAGDGH